MSTILVVGASRGLGSAIARGMAEPGDLVFLVSRTRPSFLEEQGSAVFRWIEADLRDPMVSAAAIKAAVGTVPLDLVVYNAGVWERHDYADTEPQELLDICNVNLCTPVVLFQSIVANITSGTNALIVLIGSTCGLENEGSTTVAYTATKFGIRGLAHALREVLRPAGVRVTCISPGSIASDIDWERGAEDALKQYSGQRIPVGDIVTLIAALRNMSFASCAKEIVLPAISDTDV